MYHQKMLFLHFSLPTPQSPWTEITHSLDPILNSNCQSVTVESTCNSFSVSWAIIQLWFPEHYLVQIFLLSDSVPKIWSYSCISISPLCSLTVGSWTWTWLKQLTGHQGPAHCQGQAFPSALVLLSLPEIHAVAGLMRMFRFAPGTNCHILKRVGGEMPKALASRLAWT